MHVTDKGPASVTICTICTMLTKMVVTAKSVSNALEMELT
jgi:hypothetical protein